MAKVFVVQDTGKHNLLPALQFGQVVVLTHRLLGAFTDPAPAIADLAAALKGRFTANDYLLLIGDPILIGASVHIAAAEANGPVKVLKWDRQEKAYIPVTLYI